MYICQTVPFANPRQRALHFQRHGQEFGAANEYEYERMADAFMSGPLETQMRECIRRMNPFDRIRLDTVTRYFGVESSSLCIRTFMVKEAFNIAYHGGPDAFMEHKRTEVR